jgi:hypothetical protein
MLEQPVQATAINEAVKRTILERTGNMKNASVSKLGLQENFVDKWMLTRILVVWGDECHSESSQAKRRFSKCDHSGALGWEMAP